MVKETFAVVNNNNNNNDEIFSSSMKLQGRQLHSL